MKSGWTYLCTDYEDDGENKLKVIYYERMKSIYGTVATIEIGRSTQLDDEKETEVSVIREYTKNIGGMIPWREFTMADYERCRHEEGRSFCQFGDGCSSSANPVRYSKTRRYNDNRRYKYDD